MTPQLNAWLQFFGTVLGAGLAAGWTAYQAGARGAGPYIVGVIAVAGVLKAGFTDSPKDAGKTFVEVPTIPKNDV